MNEKLYSNFGRRKNMGIFGGGYDKPGKGVDKNEPKKKGFFLFFDIVIRKFTKFLGANCLYAITSIIWIAILYIFGGIVLSSTHIVQNVSDTIISLGTESSAENVQGSIMILIQLAFSIGVFTFWGSGPATAAYSYITRCFTRGEHTWVLSDGADKFKENFKQSMVVVLIDAVLLVFGINAILFYHSLYVSTGSMLWMMLLYVMILVLVVYTMMHPYLYQIMVTFECGIGSLYKNALLITLAKLPGNFFTTFIGVLIYGALFTFVNPLAAAIIVVVIGLCVTCYPPQFYAARVIERSILKDMKEKQHKVEYIGEEE